MEKRIKLRTRNSGLDQSGLCTGLCLPFLCLLLSGTASATSRIGPAIYHVRLSCTMTGVPASLGFTEYGLCDAARTAIQELADGDIDANIATVEGWSNFAKQNKQSLVQECLEHEALPGTCTDYDLLYQGQEVPIIKVDKDAVDNADPEGLTAIVTLGLNPATASTGVMVEVIEPPLNVMPQVQTKLPTVELGPTPTASSLHAGVKFALAAYFVPDTLNRIMANVVARRENNRRAAHHP
jgi:hypothetical protein